MSENDERTDGPAPREAEEAPEEAKNYIEGIIDTRVAAVYAETWPAVLEAVVDRLAERIELDPEKVATRAADIAQATIERSATEIIKRRLVRAPAGAGGSDGRASDGGGGDGGGDDGLGGLRDLEGLPEGPGRAEGPAAPRPVSTGDRRDQMVTGLLMGLTRIFEDPTGFLTAGIDAYVKLKQAGKGPPDDLALAQALYERKPWLFDVFGKPDPLEEKIPTILARALDLGMKVGSRATPGGSDGAKALRDLVRGAGKARRVEPSEDRPVPGRPVDLSAASGAADTPVPDRAPPEPAIAPAAQDPRPARGKLRKAA